MNTLHMIRNSDRTLQEMLKLSPLKAWLVRHGHSSIVKFAQLEVSDFQAPLVFQVMWHVQAFVGLMLHKQCTFQHFVYVYIYV